MGASSQESRLERGNQGPPATPRAHAACPAPPGRQHAAGCGVAGAPLWTLRSPDPRRQGCDRPMTLRAPASVAPLLLPRRGHEDEHLTARARWTLAVAVPRAAMHAVPPVVAATATAGRALARWAPQVAGPRAGRAAVASSLCEACCSWRAATPPLAASHECGWGGKHGAASSACSGCPAGRVSPHNCV